MNVLIVEGEKALQKEFEILLSSESWHCDIASSLPTASEKLFVNNYDMVLLDRDLPGVDGLQLLSDAGIMNMIPAIIVISAIAFTNEKIKALDLGADDYLSKPFSMTELMARMKAVLRRKLGAMQQFFSFYNFQLDIKNKMLMYYSEHIALTRKEYELLEFLYLNRNRSVSRQKLSEHIWGSDHDNGHNSNYVEVHIKNLRQKLSKYGEVNWFETIRGFGYKLNIPEVVTA